MIIFTSAPMSFKVKCLKVHEWIGLPTDILDNLINLRKRFDWLQTLRCNDQILLFDSVCYEILCCYIWSLSRYSFGLRFYRNQYSVLRDKITSVVRNDKNK